MLGLVHLWLSAYSRVALVLLIAAGLGYPLARRLPRGPTTPILTLLAGLAVLSAVAALLAWVHLFRGWTITLVGLAGFAYSLPRLRLDIGGVRAALRRSRGRRPRCAVIVCFALLGVLLLALSTLPLYPPKDDGTLYHLPLARELVRHHGLTFTPFVRYSFFPQANEALYAVTMLPGSSLPAPASLEYAVLALGVLLLPLWFRQSGRWLGGGLVAGAMVLASPVVVYAGTSAFVDTFTLVLILAGVLVVLDAAERRVAPLPGLILAGVLLGEAAATKYTGALFGAIAVFAVLVVAGRAPALWRALPAGLAAALLIAVPWYAWTVHVTGDPLYPFGTSVFGNPANLWTVNELHHQTAAARAAAPGIGGVLHNDLRLLLGQAQYDTGSGRSPLSWWLPIGLLGFALRSARCDRTFLGVALAAVFSVAITFGLSADPRYVVPGLGPVVLLSGLAVDRLLWALWPRIAGRRFTGRLIPASYAVAAVLLVWSSASYAIERVSVDGLPGSSASKVAEYLTTHLICYPAIVWMNTQEGPGYRAWNLACEKTHFYADGELVGDAFGLGSWYRVLDRGKGGVPRLPDPRTLKQRLAGLSVNWLILPTRVVPDPRAVEAGGLFRLVATVDDFDIFRIPKD